MSKAISKDIIAPKEWIVFARFAFLLVVISITSLYRNPSLLKSNNILFQWMRGISLFAISYLTYAAYETLPIYVAGSIGGSEPIFIGLIGILFGFEKEFLSLISILMMGFTGVVMVNYIGSNSLSISELHSYSKGIIFLLIANLICSFGGYITQMIHKNKDKVETILAHTSITVVFLIPMMTWFRSGCPPIGFKELVHYVGEFVEIMAPFKSKLLILCVLSTISQFIYILSLKYLDPGIHASIQNLSIFLSILYGRIFKGEHITFKICIAAILVFTSTSILLYRSILNKSSDDNSAKYRRLSFISIFLIGISWILFAIF